MIFLLALVYMVRPLVLPMGTTAVLGPTASQAAMEPVLYRRPTTVSMSRDGTIGLVVGKSEEHSFDRVLIVRKGVASSVIPPVPNSLLARFFLSVYNKQHGTTGLNESLLIQIRNLVIGDRDSLFVGILSGVGGAYSAEQEASFKWSSSAWESSPGLPVSAAIPKNLWVAAADGSNDIGYGADQLYLDPANQSQLGANALDNIALWMRGRKFSQLGRGIVTDIRGDIVVGYDAHYVPPGIDVTPASQVVSAELWFDVNHRLLGRGVAWSVNAGGDVVGDDRATLKAVGFPTLWRKGKAIRLSSQHGSAFAIGDDGTIVGDQESGAFIIGPGQLTKGPVLLDSVLSGSGWHVRAAYAICDSGDILALASHSGEDHMVLLEKTKDGQR